MDLVKVNVEGLLRKLAEAYLTAGIASAAPLKALPAFAVPGTADLAPVAARWLPVALADLPETALSESLRHVAPLLPWSEEQLIEMPALAGAYTSVEICGPDGVVKAEGLRCGLYLQAAQTLYPSHDHAAEEHYLVLSGDAEWVRNTSDLIAWPCGTIVHHAPFDVHAMKTRGKPLLAAWLWTGDIGFGSYRFVNAK